MKTYKVYESGSGKWVGVRDGEVKYYSDEAMATDFDDLHLASAHGCFYAFSIYKDTMFAVPKGTNHYPWECSKVSAAVKQYRESLKCSQDG